MKYIFTDLCLLTFSLEAYCKASLFVQCEILIIGFHKISIVGTRKFSAVLRNQNFKMNFINLGPNIV